MPLLTDWNCRNCFSSAHGGWEGTSTSVPFSCSRHWFCFLPRLPCLFREFFFSIHTFCFASLPFISTRTFFLFSSTTSFSIGDFFLLENPRLILHLRREIGYSLALHPNISKHILHTIQYISSGFEKENLSNNQELLSLLIISLILVTLMFYSGVIS